MSHDLSIKAQALDEDTTCKACRRSPGSQRRRPEGTEFGEWSLLAQLKGDVADHTLENGIHIITITGIPHTISPSYRRRTYAHLASMTYLRLSTTRRAAVQRGAA